MFRYSLEAPQEVIMLKGIHFVENKIETNRSLFCLLKRSFQS